MPMPPAAEETENDKAEEVKPEEAKTEEEKPADPEEQKALQEDKDSPEAAKRAAHIAKLEALCADISAERAKWEADIDAVYDILREGTARAQEVTNATLARVRKAMRIDYFDDRSIIKEWEALLRK